MKYTLKKACTKPVLYSKNNIVTEVNDDFINLTGYSREELSGKSLRTVSSILKIDSQIQLQNIEDKDSCYMFNKQYEPIEVTISCNQADCEDKNIYSFKVKSDSSIKEKFNFAKQLYTDRKTGVAICSAPDLILLKANQNYLDFLDQPFNKMENSIGKRKEEIVTGYEGSEVEELFDDVINSGKSHHIEEFQYDYYRKGTTYWNSSIIPIYIKGKLKFIIETTIDATERVLERKAIEEKNEKLQAIIENMSDELIIVDKHNKYIFLNGNTDEFMYNPDSVKKVGDTIVHTKHYDSEGNLIQLENSPIFRVLNGERIKALKITSNRPDGIFHYNLSGSPLYDKNGNVEAAILCKRNVTDIVNKADLIKTQKEELEAIIDNMSDVLLIFDKDGEIVRHNNFAKEAGFLKHSQPGNKEGGSEKLEYFASEEKLFLSLKEGSIPDKILNGERISARKIRIETDNNIEHYEVSGNPIYDSKGDFAAGILLVRNITDRIKAEENLLIKTQYNLLSSIIENLDIGFIRYSYPDYSIVGINNKAYSDLKQINPQLVSQTSIIGQNYYDIFYEDNNTIKNLIEKKNSGYFSYRKLCMAGKEKFIKFMFQPLRGLNNQIVEIIVISIDITDEINEKNKMQETLKIQDEIFANISHELKTPLNVIFSTNQLMELYLKNESM
ncbi:MAG: PAS domain-containing protein, partial [Clostridiaceae bacterium]